jgi:hypothetical protein
MSGGNDFVELRGLLREILARQHSLEIKTQALSRQISRIARAAKVPLDLAALSEVQAAEVALQATIAANRRLALDAAISAGAIVH